MEKLVIASIYHGKKNINIYLPFSVMYTGGFLYVSLMCVTR